MGLLLFKDSEGLFFPYYRATNNFVRAHSNEPENDIPSASLWYAGLSLKEKVNMNMNSMNYNALTYFRQNVRLLVEKVFTIFALQSYVRR